MVEQAYEQTSIGVRTARRFLVCRNQQRLEGVRGNSAGQVKTEVFCSLAGGVNAPPLSCDYYSIFCCFLSRKNRVNFGLGNPLKKQVTDEYTNAE